MPKQIIALEDIFSFSTLSGVTLSPSGRWAAFMTSTADEAMNGYRSNIHIVDTQSGECRQLTGSGSDRAVYWESDDALIITSRRLPLPEGEKEPFTRFYRISPEGGEAIPAFDIKEGVGGVQIVSDDCLLLRITKDFSGWEKKNYQAFDEIPFWFNGRGFINGKRPALALYTPSTGEVTLLTGDHFETGDAALSPDHTKIVYTGIDMIGAKTRRSGLFLYDIAEKTTRTLIDPANVCVDRVAFFDDTTMLIGINPVKDSHSNDILYCYDLTTDTYTAYENQPDIAMMQLKRQDDGLYFCCDNWGASRIGVFAKDGTIRDIALPEGQTVQSFDVVDGKIAFTGEKYGSLQECYLIKDGEAVCVSAINAAYEESHALLPVERFVFKNRAGLDLEGFVIRPAGYEPGKRYPGLLEIHGGPKVSYTAAYAHEMQAYASAGYFVFFCNPRGSSGRGSDFADVTGKLGMIDYEDIMDFTDEVLRREADLDPARLGVLGGSYGGFMTNWIIGHTDRFAAACSQRSISNYTTKCLTTDIGHYHNLSQMETDPWKDFDKFWFHSPLKYADRVKTPTLFIHSDHDFRCWMSEGIQMHQALCRFGVDTKLCLFTDENHELSRSGRPKGRLGRLREMLAWFEKYLKA